MIPTLVTFTSLGRIGSKGLDVFTRLLLVEEPNNSFTLPLNVYFPTRTQTRPSVGWLP